MPEKIKPALLLILVTLIVTPASEADALDPRRSLSLSDPERVELLSEMRRMLASIQGIFSGIGTDQVRGHADRVAAAAGARSPSAVLAGAMGRVRRDSP